MDKTGHCVNCGVNMITEQVIDGKLQKRLMSNYTEHYYNLSDGSKIRVAMCRDCKGNLDNVSVEKVMDNIHEGWGKQTDLTIVMNDKCEQVKNKKKKEK